MNTIVGKIDLGSDFKHTIRARDGHRCKICKSKVKLTLHHIIPICYLFRKEELIYFNDALNLVTLCEPCHIDIHSGRMYIPKYIKNRWNLLDLMQRVEESRELMRKRLTCPKESGKL